MREAEGQPNNKDSGWPTLFFYGKQMNKQDNSYNEVHSILICNWKRDIIEWNVMNQKQAVHQYAPTFF